MTLPNQETQEIQNATLCFITFFISFQNQVVKSPADFPVPIIDNQVNKLFYCFIAQYSWNSKCNNFDAESN